jgi:hypothetical protein
MINKGREHVMTNDTIPKTIVMIMGGRICDTVGALL